MPESLMTIRKRVPLRRLVPVVCVIALSVMLAGCDKCGNSIFHADAGPAFCQDKLPQ